MSLPTTTTRLESLSNEILLDIFEYLDAYTLCSVFYRINWRLNNLLRYCQLNIQFDENKRNKKIWNTLAKFVNPTKIYTLSLYGVDIHEQFLPSATTDNLCFLYFYHMNRDSIDRILRHLPIVNRIKTLSIYQKGDCRNFNNFFCDYVFFEYGNRLSSLVNLSLRGSDRKNEFPIIATVFSKLRRLSLSNFTWTPNLVQFLRENTPNLRSLYCHRTISHINQPITSVIKHIQELDINIMGDLIDLEDILSILPSLKRLRIVWDNTRWPAVVDGIQWQEIIEKYLPCLQCFTINFAVGIDEAVVETFFKSQFWSKRKVVMKSVRTKILPRYGMVKKIYFGQQWRFKYFNCDEVKSRRTLCNLNLPRQSSPIPYTWSPSQLSPLPVRSLWTPPRSPSPLKIWSMSRWQQRTRLKSRSQSPWQFCSRRRSRSRSRSGSSWLSCSRRRSRSRSPWQSCSRRRPRSRTPSQSHSRRRSRSRTPSQSHSRRRSRSRSPSQSRSRRRPRFRSPWQSCSRRRPRSRAPSQSHSRRRSRSRSPSQSHSRRRSRFRSPWQSCSRRRPRSRAPSQSRSRRRSRSRSPWQSHSRRRSRLR